MRCIFLSVGGEIGREELRRKGGIWRRGDEEGEEGGGGGGWSRGAVRVHTGGILNTNSRAFITEIFLVYCRGRTSEPFNILESL